MVKLKKILYFCAGLLIFSGCQKPEIEIVDFASFHVTKTEYYDVVVDGELNPSINTMEDNAGAAKIASTTGMELLKSVLGSYQSNRLLHVVGTYTGHDVDGSPITLSGKVLIPADGKVENMILVSHFTIGANRECPSESFPLEGLLAAKGYAVVIADYIGYGVTRNRIHPYMHVESTSRSVVDMGVAVKSFLEHIGCKPQSDNVILVGYSQGGSTTLGVMRILQKEYSSSMPIKKVYAGGGPYDLAATFDISILQDKVGIPCAIPMIVQGVNEGEDLGLNLDDFFKPVLREHIDEWVNSKEYTVGQINRLMNATKVSDIMTDAARDKTNPQTAKLYRSLRNNSILNFIPHSPVYIFHSTVDNTVPFVNATKAEEYFKGKDVVYDFDDYGSHQFAAARFILNVYKDLK